MVWFPEPNVTNANERFWGQREKKGKIEMFLLPDQLRLACEEEPDMKNRVSLTFSLAMHGNVKNSPIFQCAIQQFAR